MHATHSMTLIVRLKCRGNTVQSKEREREEKRKRRIRHHETEKLYKALIGYKETAPCFFSCCLCVRVCCTDVSWAIWFGTYSTRKEEMEVHLGLCNN